MPHGAESTESSCDRHTEYCSNRENLLMTRSSFRLGLVSILLAALGARAGAQADEEFARRQLESGRSFMENKRYAEALKDFQGVVDSFPKSSVADDALLQIALYQLDTAHNLMAAQAAVDIEPSRLLAGGYGAIDVAPFGDQRLAGQPPSAHATGYRGRPACGIDHQGDVDRLAA